MKSCVTLPLLTVSEDLNVKSNVSYSFIRCISGEAVAERGERTTKANWQDAAVLWPRMGVFPDGHLRALMVPNLVTPQRFLEHLQYTGCCSSAGATGANGTAPVVRELM